MRRFKRPGQPSRSFIGDRWNLDMRRVNLLPEQWGWQLVQIDDERFVSRSKFGVGPRDGGKRFREAVEDRID